jgi:hypothetical protein
VTKIQANIKSTITFLHLAGLALGIGGAWILDGFIIKHLTLKISQEKYDVIVFVSKIVLLGLLILWLSGLLFISFYYFYSPDMLFNQKVWEKIVIVTILTINGVFVHKTVLPKFQTAINDNLLNTLSYQEKKWCLLVLYHLYIGCFPWFLASPKS